MGVRKERSNTDTAGVMARVRSGRDWIDALGVGAVSVGLAALVLRLWETSLRIPFAYIERDVSPLAYGPDAPFYLMLTKGMVDHGWHLSNSSLAAPYGQDLFDLPHGLDNLNLVIIRLFSLVLGDAALTVNVFYLFTFAAVSAVAFLVLRRLGISRAVSATMSILYAFLPYHFARGTAHLLLSAYYVVPLAALLMVRVASDDPPFTGPRDDGDRRFSLRGRSSFLWLLGCAVVASTGAYYAAIAMTLLAAFLVIDFIARRRTRNLVSGGAALAAIALVALLNLTPTFVYWLDNGQNPDVVDRGADQTEVVGLKISQLVLPVEGHRVSALADLQDSSTRSSVIRSERGQQLGAIGAIGFLGMLGVVLAAVLSRRGPPATGADNRDDPPTSADPGIGTPLSVIRTFGVATVIAILVGAISGFALVFSGLGFTEIRSWNRVSVFIGFFALAAVGFTLDWGFRRWFTRPWRPVAIAATLLAVGAVGILDQVSPSVVPDYEATARTWNSDERFVQRIERTLGPNAEVFQLPTWFFPEAGPLGGLGPYDEARGYLHSDTLRWSWGGMRGRDHNWVSAVAQLPEPELFEAVAAVGFRGVMVNRVGYGEFLKFKEQEITDATGVRPIISSDGQLSFFDLRDYAKRVRTELGPERVKALRERTLTTDGDIHKPA